MIISQMVTLYGYKLEQYNLWLIAKVVVVIKILRILMKLTLMNKTLLINLYEIIIYINSRKVKRSSN
jgi:nicotinamide riboside transporter PnuC